MELVQYEGCVAWDLFAINVQKGAKQCEKQYQTMIQIYKNQKVSSMLHIFLIHYDICIE